jgi:hypothetical protein
VLVDRRRQAHDVDDDVMLLNETHGFVAGDVFDARTRRSQTAIADERTTFEQALRWSLHQVRVSGART